MLSPTQVRMAMAMLDIDRGALAVIVGVDKQTISSFIHEARQGINSVTLAKIEDYFKANGAVFLDEGDASPGGGVGVRRRDPTASGPLRIRG